MFTLHSHRRSIVTEWPLHVPQQDSPIISTCVTYQQSVRFKVWTFIYYHLQGNRNSSSLQSEVTHWMANQVQTCLLNLHSIAYQSSAIPFWAFYTITSPRGPCTHLPVTYFQFHGTTFHSVLMLFIAQLPKYGTPYGLTFCSLKRSLHLDVIWRPTTFSQPILPPSASPSPMCLDSLLRLRC